MGVTEFQLSGIVPAPIVGVGVLVHAVPGAAVAVGPFYVRGSLLVAQLHATFSSTAPFSCGHLGAHPVTDIDPASTVGLWCTAQEEIAFEARRGGTYGDGAYWDLWVEAEIPEFFVAGDLLLQLCLGGAPVSLSISHERIGAARREFKQFGDLGA